MAGCLAATHLMRCRYVSCLLELAQASQCGPHLLLPAFLAAFEQARNACHAFKQARNTDMKAVKTSQTPLRICRLTGPVPAVTPTAEPGAVAHNIERASNIELWDKPGGRSGVQHLQHPVLLVAEAALWAAQCSARHCRPRSAAQGCLSVSSVTLTAHAAAQMFGDGLTLIAARRTFHINSL